MIAYGGSPRASISLAKASKAYAFIKRRGYVIPEDVRAVCPDVLLSLIHIFVPGDETGIGRRKTGDFISEQEGIFSLYAV